MRALEELCRLYWYPVYAFIRRQGASSEEAEDLAQGFFARLLERRDLLSAEREKGRLRSFLLARVKNHLVQDWRRRTAAKRGGTGQPLSLDDAEVRYALEPAGLVSAEALFDRRWALETFETALRRLESEYADAGKRDLFEALMPWLSSRPSDQTYASLAPGLGLTPGALQVAVHRLRQRFRRCLENAVADTVADPDEVESELRYLLSLVAT